MEAFQRFVEARLTGNENLWTKMTKVKLLSWNATAKEVKLKSGSAALICWHSLTGCNTTGHIQQKGKRGFFTAFLDARPAVAAIADLGVGAEPSAEVVRGCEEFLCALFCPK